MLLRSIRTTRSSTLNPAVAVTEEGSTVDDVDVDDNEVDVEVVVDVNMGVDNACIL